MTSYFVQVFTAVAKEFNWYKKHHNGVIESFYQDVFSISNTSIISVNNVPVDFERINVPYRGSHIIRDPRDLLVSGYKYHRWCRETWVTKPMEKWLAQVLKLDQFEFDKELKAGSYQDVLNQVDEVTGYLLELNYRQSQFNQMLEWDYNNPHLYEFKYEDVFGNETAVFSNLFKHYGFSEKMIEMALPYAEEYSFKNLRNKGGTGEQKHASTGFSGQWKKDIPREILEEFTRRHPGLLAKLNYA